MELEIFKSNFGFYNFRTNNGRPTDEMVNYLKANGYRWSRNHNAWYPATNEAKEKNLHEDFVADFQKRFFDPASQEQKSFAQKQATQNLAEQALANDDKQTEQSATITLDEQGVKNIAEFAANSAIANERNKIAQLEALIAELQAERQRDKEKIARYEFELANRRDESLSEFYAQQEQEEIDNDAEWERENSLTDEEERSIIENYETPKVVQAIEDHEDMAQSMTGEQMFNALHEIAEMAAREDEPKAEKAVLREAKKETDENLMLTPEEIELAKSVLPTTQYVSTLRYAQGEEREFFIKTLKEIANSVKNAPKLYETDGAEHPIVLRYFHPTGTETLVTEIGKNGEAYGYQCLNGDYEMAEWGYIDLNKVKNIRGMEADYHVEEGMTVERWLYKEQPDMFPQYAKYAESTEKTPFDVAQDTGNDIEAIAGALNENKPLFAELTEEEKSKIFFGLWEAEDKGLMEYHEEHFPGDRYPAYPGDAFVEEYLLKHLSQYDFAQLKETFLEEEKSEKNEFVPKPVSLESILAAMDMRPEMTADGKILVFDEQRKEYIDNGEDFEGNGQKAWEFSSAAEIFERLDIFIKEAFIDDMEDQLNAVGIKYTEDGHARSLEECCELYKKEIENGNTQLSEGELNLAFGIVNPETVILPEQNRQMSVENQKTEQIPVRDELLSHVKYFVTEFAEFPSYDDTESMSLEDAVKLVRERKQQEHNYTNFGTNALFTVGIEIDGEKFGNDGASYNPETGNFETLMFEANSLFRKYGAVALEELADEIQRQNNGLPPAMRLPCNFNPADFGLEENEEVLVEAENGQMMTPDELRRWNEEQEMQHGHDSEFDELKEGKTFALEAAKEKESEQAMAETVTPEEVQQEKSLINKKIEQLKGELNELENTKGINQDELDESIQKKLIQKYEGLTDDDIKQQILWKKENQRKNEETHKAVVELMKEEREWQSQPQEGELLSYDETHPTYTLTNKETKRQISIQPTGNLTKNVKELGRLGSLTEANEVIGKIRDLGFDIYSTGNRVVIFNDDKFYDFDAYADSGKFNYATERFEHNLDKRNLKDWDFKDFISGGLKITKAMKEFEKIEGIEQPRKEEDRLMSVDSAEVKVPAEEIETSWHLSQNKQDTESPTVYRICIQNRYDNHPEIERKVLNTVNSHDFPENFKKLFKSLPDEVNGEPAYFGNFFSAKPDFSSGYVRYSNGRGWHYLLPFEVKDNKVEFAKSEKSPTDFSWDEKIANKLVGEKFEIEDCYIEYDFSNKNIYGQKGFHTTNVEEFISKIKNAQKTQADIAKSNSIGQQPASKKDIKAIREQCREILKKPDSEITESDKAILAQYEGAGGLNEENRTNAGILNEFYTPNNLVEKVWQIVDAYAPEAKTVLEPSAGVGKFANNRPNNEFTMYELDETSARINKILHPEANTIQGAYQKQFFDDGERFRRTDFEQPKYDVVIGNPPYGAYNDKYKGLGEGKEFDRYEEYFISKGLDALKDENSVMAFVVPSGFLNTASDKQKELINSKGKLIDGYRLPVGTFPTTEVGTDIIVFQSWEKDRKEIDLNNHLVGVKAHAQFTNKWLGETQKNYLKILSENEWFRQHPEKILGEVKTRTNRFGKEEEYVAVHEGLTVQDELNKIPSMLPKVESEKPKLKTYHTLKEEEVKNLTEVTQEEFNAIVDALYQEPSPDYKNIPAIIKLPGMNEKLAEKLGIENANFYMKSHIAHSQPQRKGEYDQDLRIDEFKGMLDFIKVCETAYIDNEEKHQNFMLAGLDSQDNNKANKIVFNKDELGNYIVTTGKITARELDKPEYSKVAVGVEPTIWHEHNAQAPATMLRPSTTSLDENSIAQKEEITSSSDEEVPKIFLKTTDEIEAAIPDDYTIPFKLHGEQMSKRQLATAMWYIKDATEENKSIHFYGQVWQEAIQEIASQSGMNTQQVVDMFYGAYQEINKAAYLKSIGQVSEKIHAIENEKQKKEQSVEQKKSLEDSIYDKYIEAGIQPVFGTQEEYARKIAQEISSALETKRPVDIGTIRQHLSLKNDRVSFEEKKLVKQIFEENTGLKLPPFFNDYDVFDEHMNKVLSDWAKNEHQQSQSVVHGSSNEPLTTEPTSDSQQAKTSRPKKEKWNITKSKGEVMTAEEFSRLYGKDFDEREFPIWRATDWQGNIDLEKLSAADIYYMEESGNYVQKDIGEWTHKVLFTSGDIYKKLDEQKRLLNQAKGSEIAPIFENNIALLESVRKEPLAMENIHFGVKTPLAEEFTIPTIDAEGERIDLNLQESFILWCQNATLATQGWRGEIDFATANISREELGDEVSFWDVVQYIDGKPVKADSVRGYRTWNMSDEEKSAEKAERKKEADLKRQARADTANRLFDKYLHEGLDEATKARLSGEYNRRFNSFIAPDYSKLPLFVEGMSAYKGDSKFKLYDQQIKGISFLCNKGNGLLAYDVGVGKTAAGIVATVNQIQTWRSKRPLIVVPNQVYSKWYTDIKQLFPNTQVNDLYNFNKQSLSGFVDKENPHKLNIPENTISLCTYEALKNITFTDESCSHELFDDFSNLLSVDFDKSERDNELDADKIRNTLGAASQVKNPNYVFFEECGFDHLTVDEAHHFKNLWVVPRPKKKGESNEYSGIPSGKPSARALKMYAMTQLVQKHNDDRNVFMLTATPFTNSPTEVYSMLSYIGRERLKEAGIKNLREFFDEFAQTRQELGVNAKGEIDTKQVMKNWKELQSLQNILTEFIDKVDGEEAGIFRPNKFAHLKPLDMSELQKELREIDEKRMTGNLYGEEGEHIESTSADTIVAMNNMRLACVAPALANPAMYPGVELPPLSELVETSPKLKFVCDAIVDMYKEHPNKGQFMYVPLGKDSHGIIKDYLVKHGTPKDAIEIINGEINNTVEKKEKVASRFNDEKNPCKILIGGQNTTEGIDLNGNSFVMYNCSLGWNPSETIQAEGRIWRQGNLQGNVHVVYPVMNDSIDSVLFQKHDEKIHRINELWTYKGDALNVEDINPEDLKLDLIKDPTKKAKLILDNETKEVRAELSKINLKIKDFDDIIELRKQLTLDFDDTKERIESYEKQIRDYKERELEVPSWITTELKLKKQEYLKVARGRDAVENKLASLNIVTDDDIMQYVRDLNTQKHSCEEKIKNVEDNLPQIMEKLKIEQMEQKLMEYPVEKQREILESDILENLRPMPEVKHEIKTKRHEEMLAEKLKAGEITQEEYDLYKIAGYEKYEKWLNGEIESLEAGGEPYTENQEAVEEKSDRQMSVETDSRDDMNLLEEKLSKAVGKRIVLGDADAERTEYSVKYKVYRTDSPQEEPKFYGTLTHFFDEKGTNSFTDNAGASFNLTDNLDNEFEHVVDYLKRDIAQGVYKDNAPNEESLKINTVSGLPAKEQLEQLKKENEKNKPNKPTFDEGDLFFGMSEDEMFVHSPEKEYGTFEHIPESHLFNYGNDDIHLTPEQLCKAEQKRDEIVLPILSGKESGMYKAFNDFAKHGVFDVVGKKIDLADEGKISKEGWSQLHAAMNIYRSKEFETMRYVLVDKFSGEIRDQLAVSSHMPNKCSVAGEESEENLQKLIRQAEKTDSLIVAVHNHPSGNVTESKEDVEFTDTLQNRLGDKFAGHIILDHDTFNLYTKESGWKMKLDWENVNSEDKLVNKDFAFKNDAILGHETLMAVAQKINATNNWNDDFIPVVFANSDNLVTGVKLYDKSFFNKDAHAIRNKFQFDGLEAGATKAFPIVTEHFTNKLDLGETVVFINRMKELVHQNAFTDAALGNGTVTEISNINPGLPFYSDFDNKSPKIDFTWQSKINPTLFEQMQMGMMKIEQVNEPVREQEKPRMKKAACMGY